ncbi:uncharacterized protein FIBRA_01993 [Fibroporia radiculosa]|uniref:Uncharacterized protein n=1 Tax=Fibroporia radiculosa TaxID=599839 RepID=J4G1A6_9APHY|nr:uncharacterized protein FIBRA_01993 [Fibroporia radiculosa]CCL99968.1 predicted protein [Fibroporia radiculosa]
MGKFYESIPPNLIKWIKLQQLFWVASAPLSEYGHVNVSPKGLRGSLHIEDPNRVWYEDVTGSGSETVAHVRENGRMTIMFSAFEGTPRILRLFGKGTVHEFGTPEYEALLPPDRRRPGSRCAVVMDVEKVGTSCGLGVPLYTFNSHRPSLLNIAARLEDADQAFDGEATQARDSDVDRGIAEKGIKAWWTAQNTESIDGLPALQSAFKSHVTPVHAPPDGEWGKTTESQPSQPSQSSQPSQPSQAGDRRPLLGTKDGLMEVLRLISVFLMGLAVAAAYIKTSHDVQAM